MYRCIGHLAWDRCFAKLLLFFRFSQIIKDVSEPQLVKPEKLLALEALMKKQWYPTGINFLPFRIIQHSFQ